MLFIYIDYLNELRIKKIYLTIDGLPDMHNSVRYTVDDNHTFDKIVSNIRLVLDKYPDILIIVKMNFPDSFELDINELIKNYSEFKKRIRLNMTSIVDDYYNAKIYKDWSSIYYKDLLDNGFAVYKLPGNKISGGCPAYNEKSLAFSPDGKIYKCIEGIGTNHFEIGKIKNKMIYINEVYFNKINKFNIFENKQCVDCLLFPHCMGGCLFKQYKSMKCHNKSNRIESVKEMISYFFNHYNS